MVIYLLTWGFSVDSQIEMTGSFVVVFFYDFPKDKFLRIFITFQVESPGFLLTWAGKESEAEVFLIILNCRYFKINLLNFEQRQFHPWAFLILFRLFIPHITPIGNSTGSEQASQDQLPIKDSGQLHLTQK